MGRRAQREREREKERERERERERESKKKKIDKLRCQLMFFAESYHDFILFDLDVIKSYGEMKMSRKKLMIIKFRVKKRDAQFRKMCTISIFKR